MLKRFLKPKALPAIPDGQRVYAVGDIHGRLDLLDQLLTMIEADDAGRSSADTTIIFLGDLVDRGPESCGVVERLRALSEQRPGVRFLAGNHEEVFLLALAGDLRALKLFSRIGGRETVMSYGVSHDEYESMSYEEMAAALDRLVPDRHRRFLESFENLIEIGDYAFVHAGVRPGVALADQIAADLRWIREPFLNHRGRLERVVVHGHTIREEVEMLPSRIGIDTGAYSSGRLTAIGLEGTENWILST